LSPTETLDVHYHAHLDVVIDGTRVEVPAGLGINAGPNGELPEHGEKGIAPLHTHDTSGVIHIEAPRPMAFTLAQVFTLWGVPLQEGQVGDYHDGGNTDRQVGVYVNGHKYQGDPRRLILKAHDEIAVVAASDGTTLDIPSSYEFAEGE
jgi:hypothetical protein